MKTFDVKGAKIAYSEHGGTPGGRTIVWAHGWGQDHRVFLPLAQSLEQAARHILIDLPGFGNSPPPPSNWGTDDYADAAAALLQTLGLQKITWAGHSFGCRIGLQLAARHPQLVDRLFLIAAAGLKRKRSFLKKIYMKARIALFKFLKHFLPAGPLKDKMYKSFGSTDYKNAGAMRGVFVKTVNEDLTPTLKDIHCPVMLIYGDRDTETPPEIGKRLKAGIAKAELIVMEGQDHYSLLADGRHQVLTRLKEFMGS